MMSPIVGLALALRPTFSDSSNACERLMPFMLSMPRSTTVLFVNVSARTSRSGTSDTRSDSGRIVAVRVTGRAAAHSSGAPSSGNRSRMRRISRSRRAR